MRLPLLLGKQLFKPQKESWKKSPVLGQRDVLFSDKKSYLCVTSSALGKPQKSYAGEKNVFKSGKNPEKYVKYIKIHYWKSLAVILILRVLINALYHTFGVSFV